MTLTSNNPLDITATFEFLGSNSLNLGAGAVLLPASEVIAVDASTLEIDGNISGGSLTQTGTGNLVLGGSSSYTGSTSVGSGGTVTASSVAALNSSTGVSLGSGATVAVASTTSGTLTTPVTVSGSAGSRGRWPTRAAAR